DDVEEYLDVSGPHDTRTTTDRNPRRDGRPLLPGAGDRGLARPHSAGVGPGEDRPTERTPGGEPERRRGAARSGICLLPDQRNGAGAEGLRWRIPARAGRRQDL